MFEFLTYLFCCVAGVLSGFLCILLFNKLPAQWLCDVGEEPQEQLKQPRLCYFPNLLLFGFIFSVCYSLLFLQFGFSLLFFLCCFSMIPLLLISVSDAKYTIIPDQFTFVLFLLGIFTAIWDLWGKHNLLHSSAFSPFFGALLSIGTLLILELFAKLIFKKEAFGFGDYKLFAALGFFVGVSNLVLSFLLTVLLSGIHFSYLLIRKKIKKDSYLPLGPYICTAFAVLLCFYRQITNFIDWYFSLLKF